MADQNDPDLPQGDDAAQPPKLPREVPHEPTDTKGKSTSLGRTTERLSTAAMSAMGKTGKVIKKTVEQGKKEKDKTFIVISILVALFIVGIVAVTFIAGRSNTEVATTKINPQFEAPLSINEEVRGWKSKTGQEVKEINDQMRELKALVEATMKRQEDSDKLLRESLQRVTSDFQKAASEKLKQVEEYAKAQQAPTGNEASVRQILDQFRSDLSGQKNSPAEARARAAQLLREAGYTEDQIRDLLAEVASKAGRISVGNIAEPALSENERQNAPDWVRPHLNALRDLIYGQALSTGKLFPEQLVNEAKNFLLANAPEKRAEITDDLALRMASLARVRRENLTPEHEELIPFLITVRDEGKIPRSDRAKIAGVVWGAKSRIPEGTTAGQLVSLAHVVGREVGSSGDQPADQTFKAMDGEAEKFATEVVSNAAFNAIQLGKGQTEQYQACELALKNYLDTARVTATADQKRAIILRAMSAGLQKAKGAGEAPKPEPTSKIDAPKPAQQAAKPEFDDRFLYFGPLKVERGKSLRALVYTVPALARSNGMDLTSPAGAAGFIAGLEQTPRLISQLIHTNAGKPMGGREFMAAAVPELIFAMRQGEILGRIPVSVTGDPERDKSPVAGIMRGTVVGAVYGPFIHDEEKAKAAAQEALPALLKQPPLTPEREKLIGDLPASQPLTAILTSYEIIRPGRLSYPAQRFQELSSRIEALVGQIGSLRDSLMDQMRAEQLGAYEENVRLFIPLSVAARDDGVLPVSTVMDLVRTDVWQYTTVYLAENLVGRQTMESVLPRYASAIAGNDAGAAIIARVTAFVSEKVFDLYKPRASAVKAETISSIANQIATEALPLVEHFVVAEAVMSRVEPRIALATNDKLKFDAIMDAMRQRADKLIVPPFSAARIDGWATQLTQEARRMLEGQAPTQAANQGNDSGQQNPGGKKTGLWPTPGMIAGTGSGQLVGTKSMTVKSRKVEIPALSYANAHILSGVDAEVGGSTNLPVIVNVNFAWSGPANSKLLMRNCRLSGTAKALAGPERVAIDLKRLSFVFPSGRSVNAEVNGFVADNISGQYGALGTYKWNFEKVLPLATLSATGQGIGDSLKNSTNATVVGITGATTTVNTADQMQQALAGGLSSGFGIMSDYFKSVLNEVRPSVSVVNGQRISVVLLEAVTVDVPEDEFSYITESGGGGFAP